MSQTQPFTFTTAAVAQVYDRQLVPRFFIQSARILLDRIALAPGERVLDVATGTGTVARLAAERVGTAGRVTAVDISPAMLDVGRSKPLPDGAAAIEWVEAPAATLPVPDGAFDVAICQQGFQFFPDRPAAARELVRALRPGGRAAVSVWGPIAVCTVFVALKAAVADVLGSEIADGFNTPFCWGDACALARTLEGAGFADVVVEPFAVPLVFEGGPEQALASLNASPLAGPIAALPPEGRGRLIDACARRLADLLDGEVVRGVLAGNLAIATKR